MDSSNDSRSFSNDSENQRDSCSTSNSLGFPREARPVEEAQQTVGASARAPLVVVHPNSVVQIGLQHAWLKSSFVRVCAVGATWNEVAQNPAATVAGVGILGLPASFDAQLEEHRRELDSLIHQASQLKWIVLANHPSNACKQWALQVGVQGYVDGDYSADRLESMVVWVHAGRRMGFDQPDHGVPQPKRGVFLDADTRIAAADKPSRVGHEQAPVVAGQRSSSPSVREAFRVEGMHRASAPKPNGVNRLETLSPREREVLEGLAAGKTNQQIASSLYLSVNTVETYRSRLRQKLKLKDRAEMVAIVRQDA